MLSVWSLSLSSTRLVRGQHTRLAAGSLTSSTDTAVELVDVKFVKPFDVEAGRKMTSIHHFESGMQFVDSSEKSNKPVVCSIAEVQTNVSTSVTVSLDRLKKNHLQEVENVQDRYVRFAEAGFHRGAFQSIQSVLMSKDGKRALARIGLPEGTKHEHDSYYHAHPAVLDGAFQLVGFVSNTMREGEAWVPAGITRVISHGRLDLCSDNLIWAHIELVDDGLKMKSCQIDLFDESGAVLISIEGFCSLGRSFCIS